MASITKRPDGRWRARYRDPDGKEHAKHFDRKVDGQRWLNEVTAAVITGQYVDPRSGRVTFRAYYDVWSSRQVWEGTTRLAMDLAARSASFADLHLAELRRSELEQWVKQMTSAGLAPGTIRTRFMNVRSVLRAAVRDRLISRDPGEGVALPRVRRAEAAMTLPTGRDVGALLQAADGWLVPMVGLAAFAGLRLGEAAAVQVGDVDYLRRRLVVRRQVQRLAGGLVEVRAPKYGSERVVFLADQLLDMLSQQVRDLPSAAPTSWMFVAQNGHPPHQNTVGHHWRRTCARAGVSGFTLHDLRHFYASGLIAAGCDVVTVQRALGHAKATTTLNTYAHLWPTAEDRTRAAAAQLLDFVTSSADSLRTDRHL